MDEQSTLMTILEGGCPDCGTDLEMKTIGGLPKHKHDFELPKGIHYDVWSNSRGPVLGITWHCNLCDKDYYVEQNKFGDWA